MKQPSKSQPWKFLLPKPVSPTGWRALLARGVLYLLTVASPAAWLEQLLRGDNHVLWGRDLLLENLAGYGFAACYHLALGTVNGLVIGTKRLLFLPLLLWQHGLAFLMIAAAAIVFLVWLKRKNRLPSWRQGWRAIGRLLVGVMRLLILFGCACLWWMLAAWQTELTALLGVAVLVAVHLRGQTGYVRYYLRGLLYLTPILFAAVNFIHGRMAVPTMAERLHTEACYDVVCNARDECAVTLADSRRATIMMAGSWRDLDQAGGPQRIAAEPNGERFFIANYHLGENALLIHQPGGDREVTVPGCDNAIDVSFDPARQVVYLACETSRSVQRYSPAANVAARLAQTRGFPYALALSGERLFVTQEFFVGALGELVPGGGRVTAVDLNTGGVKVERRLGLIVWGVVWEEKRRTLWVAKPLTGEVLALDENLEIQARIRVDYGPRDLALDPRRDRLLAGNYLTGTLSVIDTATRKKNHELRPGNPFAAGQVRGVHVSPNGDEYLCNSRGLLRLIPAADRR